MKANEIQFGTVLWFNLEKNKGQIRVSGEPFDIWFSLDLQRIIVAGFSEPEFGTVAPKSSVVPQKGAQVAVALETGYNREVTPDRVSLRRRFVEIAAWNYAFEYQDVKRNIVARPVYEYEVVEFRFYKGEPVSENQREVIATGTATELQAKYQRGDANDPLAPESKIMDITFRRRFCKKGSQGKWCNDPRPLPKGAVAEKVLPVNGHGVLLATEMELRAPAGIGGQVKVMTTGQSEVLAAA